MTRRSQALVVFMKAPRPGACKTRLSPPLLPAQAAALYRAFCEDVWSSTKSIDADRWIAYHGHEDFPTPAWLDPAAPFFHQEGDSLGERLIHAFHKMFRGGCERIVVLGSDAPTLPPVRLEEAFAALRTHEAVFGPAADGGYYLAGLSRMREGVFRGIPWSSGRVMEETRKALAREGAEARFLPSHDDVDSAEDLKRLAREAASSPELCPRTAACLAALRQENAFLREI